jgi:hypothetical protein
MFSLSARATALDNHVEDMAIDDCEKLLAVVGAEMLVLFSIDLDHPGMLHSFVSFLISTVKLAIFRKIRGMHRPNGLARSVHFLESGQAIMVCYLDVKEM